jgi:hypothetical protein
MLRTVLSVLISIYVSQAVAKNVTIEKILDLSVFGNCNIYVKRFRDDQGTVDLTEKLILVQQDLRKDYALTCIDNATRVLPIATPTASLFESCVLNIIVGIVPYHLMRLHTFMFINSYTYSSTPFSTYILIPDMLKASEFLIYPYFAILVLPVRVFYLLVSTLPNDDVNLYARPYVLVCAHCGGSTMLQNIAVSTDLAYVSSLNFSSSWLRNDVQFVTGLIQRQFDLTGCEHSPWKDVSASYRNSIPRFCNDEFALMDVLVRSFNSNLTLSSRYRREETDNRFSGHISKGYLSNPQFHHAASTWFLDVSVGVLSFCDCNPKSQKELLNAWVKPFRRSVWLCLIITFLLLCLTLEAKLHIGNKYINKRSSKDYVVPFITVAGIFLRQQGSKIGNQALVLLSSFCVGLILSLYENCVTSELVVPPAKFEHNLSSLLMIAESKVIYTGPEPHTNPDLVELKIETKKWNIKLSKDQLQWDRELHQKDLPLENGTRLSYFGFCSAVESGILLSKIKLQNNKCHCYLVKHAFRQRGLYLIFELFLRNRFAFICNILRENGILSFFSEKHRKHNINIFHTKLRRLMEKRMIRSDFFLREGPKMELINLESMYFIFVIFGGMGFLAVNIFILMEIDWLLLYVKTKGLVLKCVQPLCSFNYVMFTLFRCFITFQNVVVGITP